MSLSRLPIGTIHAKRILERPALAVAIIVIVGIATGLTACQRSIIAGAGHNSPVAGMTEDEKHRLYSAALAASESPLDTDLFKDVCKRIGIFDAKGKPNDQYMAFVSAHVNWGMKSETDQFRREIDSREKAKDYINRHLLR